MTAVKRRDRLLALRLTDEEYERLKTASAAAGGHSLSEYTRSELLNVLNGGKVEERLSQLETRVGDLHQAIQTLTGLMRDNNK